MAGREREYYIDGLKALACLSVYLYHFNIALEFIVPKSFMKMLNYTPLAIWLDGRLMVCLFCIISGYLVSYSKIQSLKQLILKSINRYLRFALPILVAMILVWGMEKGVGFYIQNATEIFPDYQISDYYVRPITLPNVFYEAFFKIWYTASSIITPLWMIRFMLCGSLLIYGYNYLSYKFPKLQWMILGVFLLVLAVIDRRTWMVLATFLGGAVAKIKNSDRFPAFFKNTKVNVILLIMSAILIWFGHTAIYQGINQIISIPQGLDLNGHWKVIYALLIFYGVGNVATVKKLLSKKGLVWLSKSAMALFLLHFPWICSVGLLMYFKGFNQMDGALAYFLLLAITTSILIVICFLFNKLVEENIGKLLKKIL